VEPLPGRGNARAGRLDTLLRGWSRWCSRMTRCYAGVPVRRAHRAEPPECM